MSETIPEQVRPPLTAVEKADLLVQKAQNGLIKEGFKLGAGVGLSLWGIFGHTLEVVGDISLLTIVGAITVGSSLFGGLKGARYDMEIANKAMANAIKNQLQSPERG